MNNPHVKLREFNSKLFSAVTTVTTQFSLCLTPYLTLDRILNVILITLLINDRDICNMQYIWPMTNFLYTNSFYLLKNRKIGQGQI